MTYYSFEKTMLFFSEKLDDPVPQEDLKRGEVELMIDNLHINIAKGHSAGSLHMSINLGLLLQPIRIERLQELVRSNFLGVNTGGCTLALDQDGVALSLHCHTTWGTSAQENWEWLHRILCIARDWNKALTHWEEFVPFNGPKQEEDSATSNQSTYRA